MGDISVEFRDPAGNWHAFLGKTYDTVEAAHAACLLFSDATATAYRVCVDGEQVEVIDLVEGSWDLTEDGLSAKEPEGDDSTLSG